MKKKLTASGLDFLGKRKIALTLSGLLLIVSFVSLIGKGLTFGIDFTGGTLVEVGFEQPVELAPLREGLASAGFSDATIQHFGTSKDILVRLVPKEGMNNARVSTQVMDVVSEGNSSATLRRVEFVGPQIGDELAEDGGLALLYALLCILIYVAWRFEYRFALGSVAALGHDVILTLGLFSIFGFEFRFNGVSRTARGNRLFA
jgi:Preprotein translocase subunit SecF